MSEATFQRALKAKIESEYPSCIIMKSDPGQIQGFPDLMIIADKVAFLEVKVSQNASRRPNQEYYISLLKEKGFFAEFASPENEEEVLNGLRIYLG